MALETKEHNKHQKNYFFAFLIFVKNNHKKEFSLISETLIRQRKRDCFSLFLEKRNVQVCNVFSLGAVAINGPECSR